MYLVQPVGLIAIVMLCCDHALILAQEPEVKTAVHLGEEKPRKPSIIKIVAEPKTSRPFDWKRGEKITIGVRCVTDGETRVVGVATGVELVATRTFENRVEMMLRADIESMNKIAIAANISEFWFEIIPFAEEHRKTLADDVDFQEFLKVNPKYRAALDSDWGYGANPRLQPPTRDELPTRK